MHRAGENIHVGACNMHEFGTFYMHVALMHYECNALQSIMSEVRFTWFYTSIYISLHVLYKMSQTCILLKQAHTYMLHAGGMHIVQTCKSHACIIHVACEHECRHQ